MKALKIAALILGPIVLIAGIVYSMQGKGAPPKTSNLFADVTTGKIETIEIGSPRLITIPATNPAGEGVFFPVVRTEDGQYEIAERYRDYLVQNFKDDSRLKVDLESFRVTAAP